MGRKEPEQQESESLDELEELKKELEASKKEADEWKNKYYMQLADVQNLRKSLEEDHRNAIRYRAMGFIDGLIPALDGYYMALQGNPESQEAKNYQQGFVYIYKQIQSVLEEEGVKEVAPKEGDAYDPHSMNALELVKTDDKKKDGQVAILCLKGYSLHERLVRPATVKVYKYEEAKKEDEAEKA